MISKDILSKSTLIIFQKVRFLSVLYLESSPRAYEQYKKLDSSHHEEEKEIPYERTFDTTFQSIKATNDKAESEHHTRSYSDYDSMSDEGEDQDPFFCK